MNSSVKLTDPAAAGISSFTAISAVAGVVEDTRIAGFTESPEPTVFRSTHGRHFFDTRPHIVVNGLESINSLRDVTDRQVAALMPGLDVLSAYSVGDRARASLRQEKGRAYFALAGALAMTLVACIGLYGALAYYVGTRRRELAVRICLGAMPWTIRKIIIVRAARCAILATVLSIPLWPILAQLSSSDYLGKVSWSTERAIILSLICILGAILISLIYFVIGLVFLYCRGIYPFLGL